MSNDRNFQLQGSYTRYYDGKHAGYDSIDGPNKRRNFKTLESAIKTAHKSLMENNLPKVVRLEEEPYIDELGRRQRHLHCFAEDGHEFTYDEEYKFWHVDNMRIVDRETQRILWQARS